MKDLKPIERKERRKTEKSFILSTIKREKKGD